MFRFSRLSLGPAIAAILALALPATAQNLTASSDVNVIPAPGLATPAALYNQTMMTGFAEQQNLTLSSPLTLDIGTPGMYTSFGAGPSTTVPAGTVVSSFFLNGSWSSETAIGPFSLTFAQPILGLIVTSASLDATDSLLGAGGTTYPTGFSVRGYEGDGDTLTLSADGHTLSGTIHVTTFGDQLRVITGACATISAVSATPNVLWPPDHSMIPVTVNYSAADTCNPNASCTLSVSSNESINGTGDGDTSPDWQVLDAHHLLLRAERAGTGTGRVYTITITCDDAVATTTVTVPLNQQ